MKVYTKKGDKGKTSLVNGEKVSKSSDRLDVYGAVDELNSFIGVLRSHYDQKLLELIQNNLFNLGSLLACPSEKWESYKLVEIHEGLLKKIEDKIDEMESELSPLKNFILPAGDLGASSAHVCRTVCRRVERRLVSFSEHEPEELPVNSLELLNRLSDYFFVLSRFINKKKDVADQIWST